MKILMNYLNLNKTTKTTFQDYINLTLNLYLKFLSFNVSIPKTLNFICKK